jgi:hypothetical protein
MGKKGKPIIHQKAESPIAESEIKEVTLSGYDKILLEPDTRMFRVRSLKVMLSHHPDTGRIHMSISHPSRYPTWDEMAAIRYHLIKERVIMAMLAPPLDEYVNFHPFCFQWLQIFEDVYDGATMELLTPVTPSGLGGKSTLEKRGLM